MDWTFEYNSLGIDCIEKAFISKVSNNLMILNEESIGYKWLDFNSFINEIDWFYDKKELKDRLKKALNKLK